MKTTLKTLAAAAMILFCQQAADAATTYRSGVIGNNSSYTITFYVKIGQNGSWMRYQIAPKQNLAFSWREPVALDTVHIAFDNVANDGRNTFTYTTLAMYGSCPRPGDGWKQFFCNNRADGSGGRNIWLQR